MSAVMLELTLERHDALAELVSAWLERRQAHGGAPGGGRHRAQRARGANRAEERGGRNVAVREVEVLVQGRPGLLDVIADASGRSVHAVLGLRRPAEEVRVLGQNEDPVLGLFEDPEGLAVVVDAVHDVELAQLLLSAVTGEDLPAGGVTPVGDAGNEVTVLAFPERGILTVFEQPTGGVHPAVELLVALDEAGFNHLAAPLAVWRRGGRDLGVLQEFLSGTADGWALALTSLRDLYASGGSPEEAGGDFGPEARALGTMTARMHLALDRAFGRGTESVTSWVDEVEAAVSAVDPALLSVPGAVDAVKSLRALDLRCPAIHTHGDFHLGRTARTDQGWVLVDCLPPDPGSDGEAGGESGGERSVFRSPLADVADLLWSLHHAATVAAFERDPAGRSSLAALALAWEARNRRAFLSGYLATPGIGGLVPGDREVVRWLTALFEVRRAAVWLT